MKNEYENQIEVISRAIILDKGKILLCRNKEQGYYYFPGGHVEFGERAIEALVREIKEELNIKIKKSVFIGMVDNIFVQNSEKHQEINFVFETKVDKVHTLSQEDHIDFVLFDMKEFAKEKRIYPIALKKQILKWLKDRKIFFISQ